MNPPLVIACAGRKGGSGKTTAALGLAAWYSRHGANVLLVDLDPQGSATLALGADGAGAGLRRLLEGNAEKVQFCTIFENLALLPGGPELARMENPRPIRQALDGAALDVVLVDCPPGHAELDALALEAADVVLACCEAHRMGATWTRRPPAPCCWPAWMNAGGWTAPPPICWPVPFACPCTRYTKTPAWPRR